MIARSTTELLEVLQTGRAQNEELINRVPRERQLIAGVIDDWSVKDLVAHFLLWERWVLDRSEQLRRNGQLQPDERDTLPTDEMNRLHYERHRLLTFEQVKREEEEVFAAITQLVREFDQDALFDPNRYEFTQGIALAEEILNETTRHYEAHGESLKRFAGLA